MHRFLPIILLFACGGGTEPETYVSANQNVAGIPCPPIELDILAGNSYVDENRGLAIVLRDNDRAWVIELYDLTDCSLVQSTDLPPAEPSDYPYYLADLLYNSAYGLVGIRGPRAILVYDLEERRLGGLQTPRFQNERLVGEASGTIEHLEVWEDYLVGHTTDWGAYVFRLDSLPATPILPVTELKTEAGFRSLFLIETEQNNYYQAIMPSFNYDEISFNLNPLFPEPMAIDIDQISMNTDGNKLQFAQTGAGAIVIDLATGEVEQLVNE